MIFYHIDGQYIISNRKLKERYSVLFISTHGCAKYCIMLIIKRLS